MRLLAFVFVFIFFFFSSCKRKEYVDNNSIDSLIIVVDSLLNEVESQHNYTSDQFYLLVDDSLRINFLIQNLDIPDSLGFYQFLEQNISDFNELISVTQSEIYFAKDQLNSLKSDVVNTNISNSEYLQQIKEAKEMIFFLENRVDSNIHLVDFKYNEVFFSINDTLNEISE